jgi:3,4-dihydroxyphenylacetate 2,3-dioxygenase
MGLVHAAKITHVPTVWMSHTIPEFKGLRDSALEGYAKLSATAQAAKVETFVVLDTHWIVNQGFHLNAKPRHQGNFISHELPHMLSDLAYDYQGDAELSELIVQEVRNSGQRAIGHAHPDMGVEYGTLLPMYFINKGSFARVIPVACNQFSSMEENRQFGVAIAKAIARSDRRVSLLASGSLSHAFWPNHLSQAGVNAVNGEFNRQMDLRVLDLWQAGRWQEFTGMLPEYAVKCVGECAMADTAMLLGALGWDSYHGKGEIVTPYFGSSGTGQVIVNFPV